MEKMNWFSIFIALVLAFSKDAMFQEINHACENGTLAIDCKDELIKINEAVYGRLNSKTCSQTQRRTEYVGDCRANNSLQILKARCENKTRCTIVASNNVFNDDPCFYTDKYLEVTHTCEVGQCPYDVINILGIKLTFNPEVKGTETNSVETCPMGSSYPHQPLATRLCANNWQEPELNDCYDIASLESQLQELAKMNVTTENVEEIAAMLAIICQQTDDITTDGLQYLITSLESIVQVGSPSYDVTDTVVGFVNNIMTLHEHILAPTPNVSYIVTLLEMQVSNVLQNGQNYTRVNPYVRVRALQLSEELIEQGCTFTDHVTSNSSDSEGIAMESSITLPPSILTEVKKVYPNMSVIPVSFISYLKSSLFQTNDGTVATDEADDLGSLKTEYIGSLVIAASVEVEDVNITNLPKNSSVIIRFSTPIITFDLNETNATVDFVCVFWKEPSKGSYGMWSSEGCEKVPSDSEDSVVCSCNHLTSFAVLVKVYHSQIENEEFLLALDIISVTGCIISVVGLTLSMAAMVMTRAVRQKQQTHVHFNLCLALLGLYLSFLLGIDQAEHPNVCRGMTSLIYFFCLSSTAWMSVEAFYIYMLIWKYQRSSIRHLVITAMFLAWGLPTIASLLVYFFDNSHDYTNVKDYCFLHPGPTMYYGFLLEIFLLFFYNLNIFVLATYRVSSRKIKFANKNDKREELITRVKSTFLFWILLGMCWIFGFLATFQNPASLAFQVVFCISLSLQGFFMFYMLSVQNPEMKKSLIGRRSQTMSSSGLVQGTKSANPRKNDYWKKRSIDMQANPLSSLSNLYDFR